MERAGFPDDATLKDLDRRLTAYFKVRVPGDIDLQDLVNDVLVELPNFRGEGNIRCYAFGVARNKLADLRRGRYRRPIEPLPSEKHLAISQPGPTTALDQKRVDAMVRTAIDAIDPPYGEAVRLRLAGLDPREIAERIGVCNNTVRSRLARGLEQLRTRVITALGSDSRS
jgi:RNA polymerase sigma factor (sigma-70 family)